MRDEVLEIIASQLKIEPGTISDGMYIMEDLEADSLDVVEMLMAIEDRFGVIVPDDVITDLKKVEDIINYISGKLNV